MANLLNCLPKSAQPAARRALAEIRDAEGRGHAEVAIRQFTETYQAKYPKAVAKIVDDREVLLTFYDFPAEQWIHLRTTNPIVTSSRTSVVFDVLHEALSGWDHRREVVVSCIVQYVGDVEEHVHVQRVLSPVYGVESWTVLGDDGSPIGPVEGFWPI